MNKVIIQARLWKFLSVKRNFACNDLILRPSPYDEYLVHPPSNPFYTASILYDEKFLGYINIPVQSPIQQILLKHYSPQNTLHLS